jgi:hypothetical protein
MNNQRNFDQKVIDELIHYVYGLKDPKNNEIFYIGVGEKDRVFQHFNEAEGKLIDKIYFEDEETKNKKINKIKQIWKEGDVEWVILSYGYESQEAAMRTESAIIATLWHHPGPNFLTNKIQGQRSTYKTISDIIDMSAREINPDFPIENVFLFNIKNSIGNNLYDSTRGIWTGIAKSYFSLKESYAVGINNNISKTSYKIKSWEYLEEHKRYRFESFNHPNPDSHEPLLNKNWGKIISAAKGYWQRNPILIVEFDGKGRFRIKKGEKTKQWFNCL